MPAELVGKENYSHSALDETRGNPFAAVLCQKTTLKWGNPAGPVPRCFRCWGQILRILETLHTRPTHGLPAGLCCIDAGMIMMWGRSSGGEWMRVCGVRSRAPRIRSDAVTSELSETRPGVLCPSPPWPSGTRARAPRIRGEATALELKTGEEHWTSMAGCSRLDGPWTG